VRRYPENVQVWLSTEEKRALDAICTSARVARSAFMREAMLQFMAKVKLGEIVIGQPGWCPSLSPEEHLLRRGAEP
jgi:hypothetical protein